MDWSRAKNILIAVLLAANLILGGMLFHEASMAKKERTQAVSDTRVFLEERGMQIEADIPPDAEKLPVLFLRLEKGVQGTEDEQNTEEQAYNGVPIIVQGSNVSFEVSGKGQQAGRTITASEALLKLYAKLSSEGSAAGKTVESIDLVYLLSSGAPSYAAQDTAIPAWRICVSGETYYVDAYED